VRRVRSARTQRRRKLGGGSHPCQESGGGQKVGRTHDGSGRASLPGRETDNAREGARAGNLDGRCVAHVVLVEPRPPTPRQERDGLGRKAVDGGGRR